MDCQVERDTRETLPTDEYKEIRLSLNHRYTVETINDTMGHVAI